MDLVSATPASQARGGRRAAFAAICLANFMVLFDGTVVNLAVPPIREDLGGSLTGLEWTVNGYTIALAALILSGGILGDRYGNERVLGVGLLAFTVTSLSCGLAPTLSTLVVFRVLQGASAALMLPAVLGLLPHLFTEARERARAVSTWASVGGVAAASGPVLGGVLVHWLGWRAVFFINVPIGVLTLITAQRTIPRSPRLRASRFDLAGQALAVVMFGAACFVLVEAASLGWASPWIWGGAVVAVAAGGVLAAVERASAHPMVPLRLFGLSGYRSSVFMVALWQFVFFGELFVLSLFLQDILGHGALRAGVEFLPMTVLTALVPVLVTNRVVARFGRRVSLLAGCGFGLAACVLMQFSDAYPVLAVAMIGFGMFAGLTLPPIVAGGVAGVPAELSGRASGVMNSLRQFGGVLGVALLGSAAAADPGGGFVTGMRAGALLCGVLLVLMAFVAVRSVPRPASDVSDIQEGK